MEIPAFLLRGTWLMGEEGVKRLLGAHVAVFGVGGVGGHCAEALSRAGVGALTLTDGDTVSESNINRQLVALHSTIGLYKTRVMADRARDIHPGIRVITHEAYYSEETADDMPLDAYDYVIDCIDSVRDKLLLIERAQRAGVPILCCMGAGNKLDPGAFRIAPIEKTSVCPLARAVRQGMRARGLSSVPVLYSTEPPIPGAGATPGSAQFVTACAGLMLAGYAIRRLANI